MRAGFEICSMRGVRSKPGAITTIECVRIPSMMGCSLFVMPISFRLLLAKQSYCSLRIRHPHFYLQSIFQAAWIRPDLIDSIGRGGEIRTPDPLRPRLWNDNVR